MSEKSAPLWLKVTAVLTAAGLAAGYVTFRKNNAEQAQRESRKAPISNSEAPDDELPDPEVLEVHRAIMSSSKSAAIVLPEEMTPDFDRALMSSSKSGFIIPLDEIPDKEPTPEKKPRTLLPSSKSLIDSVFRKAPVTEEP